MTDDLRLEFAPESAEANSIISPAEGYNGEWFTIIGVRDDIGRMIVERFNALSDTPGEAFPRPDTVSMRCGTIMLDYADHDARDDAFDWLEAYGAGASPSLSSDTAGLPSDYAGLVAAAKAQYEKYIENVRDLEPAWEDLPQSHRDRMTDSLAVAIAALSRAPEAEPAAWRYRYTDYNTGRPLQWRHGRGMAFAKCPGYEAQPLFATPPAPQPIGDTCLDGRAMNEAETAFFAEKAASIHGQIRATIRAYMQALGTRQEPVPQFGGHERDLQNVLRSVLYHYGPEGAHKITSDARAARPKAGSDSDE